VEDRPFAYPPPPNYAVPLDTVVWINLKSGIHHFDGEKDYGTTKRGSYMCEKDRGRRCPHCKE